MFPAARLTDPITHDKLVPCGLIAPNPALPPPNVIIEFMPAARIGDIAVCTGAISAGIAHPPIPPVPPSPLPPNPIIKGSATVMISGTPATRWSVDTATCGVFLGDEKLMASRTVVIGG